MSYNLTCRCCTQEAHTFKFSQFSSCLLSTTSLHPMNDPKCASIMFDIPTPTILHDLIYFLNEPQPHKSHLELIVITSFLGQSCPSTKSLIIYLNLINLSCDQISDYTAQSTYSIMCHLQIVSQIQVLAMHDVTFSLCSVLGF